MDRQQIGLKLAMDALGLPLSVGSFDDRLILQKIVVIAQSAGVDLGYHFHWYLRGPYSPALTRDAFALATELEEGADEVTSWELDDASKKRLKDLRGLIADADRCQLASRVELIGSILFLLRRGRISMEDIALIQAILQLYGKHVTEAEIESALKELKEYGLWANDSA